MPRLPVSQIEVALRLPTGWEQLLLLEAQSNETRAAMAFLAPLVRFPDGEVAIETLPVPDLEYLLLQLRALVLGDRVRTDLRCTNPACAQRIDLDFRIRDYLASHRAEGQDGNADAWRTLEGVAARFRLPSAGDLAEALDSADTARTLACRCIEGDADRAAVRRIERELARLAPNLSRMLTAPCPHCGAKVPVYFDVQRFVLAELRNQAAYLYSDVHQLASRYRWSEADILAMPAQRRAQYVEISSAGVVS
ncbi:MAG: hypothetical protein ABI759_28540 [Candidatus Solibacter sp.]